MRAAGGRRRVDAYSLAREPILLRGLPELFNPTVAKTSLPFSELAEALEVLSDAKTKVLQGEILRDLFHRTMAAAGDNPESVELEMYLLLKMLMPAEDHESVYGMKTARLLQYVGKALSKKGIQSAPAQIQQWISKPQAQSSIMARGRGIVCLPELIVASQSARVPMIMITGSSSGRMRSVVTLRDIAALCQRLSTAYLMGDSTQTGAETSQVESLKEILGYLSFNEWVLLTRIIYKTIPVGIGPAAILSNVAPNGQTFYSKQRDLSRLAKYAVAEASRHNDDGATPTPSLICGVPFVPMTCETMKSPYLFRWLFSKEDKLKKPISPVDGRLIILSNGMWCTPVDGRLNKSVFVDIMDDRAMSKASRRRHVLLLREFKRARLLHESKARGFIIHYILSSENDNVVMMLLKAVSSAVGQGASMLDSAYQIEDSEDGALEPNGDILDELNNDVYVNGLLKELIGDNEEREYLSGKNKLKVSILSAPKKRPRKKASQKRGGARPKTTTKKGGSKTADRVASQVAKQAKKTKGNEKSKQTVGEHQLRPRKAIGNLGVDLASSSDDSDDNPRESRVSSSPSIVEISEDDNNSEKPSVMVQQKYDGDRIQAHILKSAIPGASAAAQTITVKLFTKWGKDVSDLYSNIRDELQSSKDLVGHAPCILDGELIVVNAAGNPLPWSSEKWRHNVNGKVSFPLSQIQPLHSTHPDDTSQVVTLVYDGWEGGKATMNSSSDDIQDQILAFATLQELAKWKGLGPTDKQRMRGRFISEKDSKLRLIVFDILMHQGDMSHKLSCRDRLNLLQRNLSSIFLRMTHIRVIEKTHSVRKVSELVKLLRDVVDEKQEGLVAKDEEKEYVFGKTKATQKIKLTGPDINTCVAGIGFSLSSTPRFCGILTAVGWTFDNEDKAENRENVLVSYSRIEVLEGDQIWKAHEHIMSLPSIVNLKELETAASSGKALELEKYKVTMILTGSDRRGGEESNDIRQIEWTPRSPENAYLGCKLILLKRGRADIQWLCNPQECKFGLSLKGDLRPIESDEYGNQTIMHHRHPVGRIEFAGHQMSACDSNKSIEAKFREAQMTATCIEEFTYRRIMRMRALPPSKQKLEEIRRVVETLQYLKENGTTEEEWPRPPPVGFCSPDGFSLMLENVSKYPCANPQLKNAQEKALKKLTPEERQAWVGLRVHSQWKNMGPVAPLPLADDTLSKERQKANIAKLMSRYEQIKKITPPFEQEYKLFHTGQKFSATTLPHDQKYLCSLPNSSSDPEHFMLGEEYRSTDDEDDEDEEEDDESEDDDCECDQMRHYRDCPQKTNVPCGGRATSLPYTRRW